MTEVQEEKKLDQWQEKMIDISEGNPGALTVLIQLYKLGLVPVIDYLFEHPDLHGSALWILYKDTYESDVLSMFEGMLPDVLIWQAGNIVKEGYLGL